MFGFSARRELVRIRTLKRNLIFRALVVATISGIAAFVAFQRAGPEQSRKIRFGKISADATYQINEQPSYTDKLIDPVTILTLVLAVSTILLWRSTESLASLARVQSDAALAANDQTRELFISETRPWLTLSGPEIDIFGDMERIFFSIKAENIGKTPARLAEIRVKVTRSQIAVAGSRTVLDFCSGLKEGSAWRDFQRSIFPGALVQLTAMDDMGIHICGRGGDFFRLVYCATYQAMDSEKIFRSGGEILFTTPNDRNSIRSTTTTDESGKALRLVRFSSEGVTFAD